MMKRTTLIVTLALVPFLAHAAPGGMAPGAGGANSAAQAQALQQELMQIQNATLEANPALVDQQEQLGALVRETMRENGHTPEADLEKMSEIRDTLEAGNVGEAERETLVTEFQELRAEFVGARQQAAADPQVQQEQQAFQEALLTAMREQDPRTDQLVQQMAQLQQRYGNP
jgi:hypothetical protein